MVFGMDVEAMRPGQAIIIDQSAPRISSFRCPEISLLCRASISFSSVLDIQASLSASLWNLGDCIAGAAATFRIACEDAAFDKRQDIAEGGVVGTFREFGPLRCSELPFEAIEKAVEHKTLARVQRGIPNGVPKTRFGEDVSESGLSAFDGAAEAGEEPIHPGRGCRERATNFVFAYTYSAGP
jgi:hypothetical protein